MNYKINYNDQESVNFTDISDEGYKLTTSRRCVTAAMSTTHISRSFLLLKIAKMNYPAIILCSM